MKKPKVKKRQYKCRECGEYVDMNPYRPMERVCPACQEQTTKTGHITTK